MAKAIATTAVFVPMASAVVGGLVTAYASRSVESMRVRAGLVQKAEERKLETLERFLLAASAWLDWLIYIEERGWRDSDQAELNPRVKERDDAYRRLVLLSSETLHDWLVNVYNPLEYKLKETYARQVRHGRRGDAQAQKIRQDFGRLLREEMMQQFRPEVAELRDPLRRKGRKNVRKSMKHLGLLR